MSKNVFLFFFLLSSINNFSWGFTAKDFGFEQGNKLTTKVFSSVLLQVDGHTLYSYNVLSDSGSLQPMEVFAVTVSVPFSEIRVEPALNWRNAPLPLTDNIREKATGEKVVAWSINAENALLQPGNKLGIFQILCESVPGVKNFYAQGYTPNDLPGGEYDSDSEQGKALTELWNFFNNSYSGLTIGPDAIPELADPTSLTVRALDLQRQAISLKWISGSLLGEKIEKYLTSAKTAFVENKLFVGRAWLEKLGQTLDQEKQRGTKNMTDNGYYLLKPNIDFILNKLPNQPKDTSEKREVEKIKNEK